MFKRYLAKRKLKKDLEALAIALEVYEFFLDEHGKERPVPQTFRKWVRRMRVMGSFKL
jgi:hypothetical protein